MTLAVRGRSRSFVDQVKGLADDIEILPDREEAK